MRDYILIDSDNYAEHGIETMMFPGGEPHVKVPQFDPNVPLLFIGKLRSWLDTGYAACVLSALEQQRLMAQDGAPIDAFIPYFPGARQDRSDGTAPLTLELMLNLLRRCAFMDLYAFDVHNVSADPFDEFEIVTNLSLTDLAVPTFDDVVGVIAPDAGARDRAREFRDKFYPKVELIECTKARDQQTGRLKWYRVPPQRSGRYVVVDDICDGGATFNLLADGCHADTRLDLVVSHGIFSKGLDAISPRYERIITTDSWCRIKPLPGSRLTVLPLAPLFDRIVLGP